MTRKWWTLLVSCAATFMLQLDVTIVIVALPSIQHGLDSSSADVQWVIDAYALTLASLLLTAGSLADRYGRCRLFVIGLVIFTAGSLLCALASWPLMLICSRSAQGVGGAILFTTSLALLAHSFQGKERGTAFAIWGTVTAIATALGPILGGLITSGTAPPDGPSRPPGARSGDISSSPCTPAVPWRSTTCSSSAASSPWSARSDR